MEQIKTNINPKRALGVMNAIANGMTRTVDGRKIQVSFDPHARTASTNGTRVVLPTPSLDLTRGEWRRLNGYVDHEVSHCIWTDVNQHEVNLHDYRQKGPDHAKASRAIHGVCNIIEDARINRMALREWGGAAENLAATYDYVTKELVKDKNLSPDAPSSALNVLHARLEGIDLSTVNVDPKALALGTRLADEVMPIIKRMMGENNLTSENTMFKEGIRIHREIVRAYGTDMTPTDDPDGQPGDGEPGEEGEGDGQGGQGDGQGEGEGQPGDGTADGTDGTDGGGQGEGNGDDGDAEGKGQGNGDGEGEKGEGEGDGKGDGPVTNQSSQDTGGSEEGNNGATGGMGQQFTSEDATDDLAKAAEEIANTMEQSMPAPDPSKMGEYAEDWEDKYSAECIKSEAKVVQKDWVKARVSSTHPNPQVDGAYIPNGFLTRLRRVLQSNALAHRRGGLEDGIDLDMDRVPAFVAGAPIVDIFERKTRGRGFTTAVNVVLDGSGSMGNGRHSVQSSIALALGQSFRQNRIASRFVVMGAGEARRRCGAGYNDLACLKDWNHTWHKIETPNVITSGSVPAGGTPIVEAFFEGFRSLLGRKDDRRILFLITDGNVCPEETRIIDKWSQRMRTMGIELVFCSIYQSHQNMGSVAQVEFPEGMNWHDGTKVIDILTDQIPSMIMEGARGMPSR